MSKSIIIIDNYLELQVIENQYPSIKNAPLVLLSSNFTLSQLESFHSRGYTWFDEQITEKDAKVILDEVHVILWSWFLDLNGNDLSEINGCSLGSAFVNSFSIILNTISRYHVGLTKQLRGDHDVYYHSLSEDIFVDVIRVLKPIIGFNLISVEGSKRVASVMLKNTIIDVGARKRDLSSLFGVVRLRDKILHYVVNVIQKNHQTKEKVLIMQAGKMNAFLEYIKCNSSENHMVLPISKISDLFKIFHNSNKFSYYYISSAFSCNADEINKLIIMLKKNIEKRIKSVDSNLLISIMDRHIFNYFEGAYRYYCSALNSIRLLKPSTIIYPAESFENFILVAQASKTVGIKNVLTSHGLMNSGRRENKQGRFKLFDSALAFGNKDVIDYQHLGINRKRIIVSSFPYFEKFIPFTNSEKSKKYKKALLLSPDIFTHPLERIGAEYEYYKGVACLLNDIGIELSGIKARHSVQFKTLGYQCNQVEINNKLVPLLSGYTTFLDVIKDVDLIIGPPSTALIEAGLSGKDYYVYQHTAFHHTDTTLLSTFYNYVNAAFNLEQLRKNILKKQPYQVNCSVNDLLELCEIDTKGDLFHKFDSSIGVISLQE